MTKGDTLVERAASFLEELSHKTTAEGGFVAKLAEPLAEDAEFLRKMKPTLVLARLRGEPPPDTSQNGAPVMQQPPSPAPEPNPKPDRTKTKSGGGPNPIVVAAAAFFTGIVVAKLVDWRGHAHPRF
jgi:hypothetical protein